MSGFTLCFDLMEMIGNQVEMKREKDTRDYWTDIGWARRPTPVLQTINELVRPCPAGEETVFDGLCNIMWTEIEEWEDNMVTSWEDQDEFWEDSDLTRAFQYGNIWGGKYRLGLA